MRLFINVASSPELGAYPVLRYVELPADVEAELRLGVSVVLQCPGGCGAEAAVKLDGAGSAYFPGHDLARPCRTGLPANAEGLRRNPAGGL